MDTCTMHAPHNRQSPPLLADRPVIAARRGLAGAFFRNGRVDFSLGLFRRLAPIVLVEDSPSDRELACEALTAGRGA